MLSYSQGNFLTRLQTTHFLLQIQLFQVQQPFHTDLISFDCHYSIKFFASHVKFPTHLIAMPEDIHTYIVSFLYYLKNIQGIIIFVKSPDGKQDLFDSFSNLSQVNSRRLEMFFFIFCCLFSSVFFLLKTNVLFPDKRGSSTFFFYVCHFSLKQFSGFEFRDFFKTVSTNILSIFEQHIFVPKFNFSF